jgi:hypothetical protein
MATPYTCPACGTEIVLEITNCWHCGHVPNAKPGECQCVSCASKATAPMQLLYDHKTDPQYEPWYLVEEDR